MKNSDLHASVGVVYNLMGKLISTSSSFGIVIYRLYRSRVGGIPKSYVVAFRAAAIGRFILPRRLDKYIDYHKRYNLYFENCRADINAIAMNAWSFFRSKRAY